MINENQQSRYPYYFLILYALTYMCNSVYNTFIPVYLNSIGFSQAAVGTLLALGPFVAIAAQPIWGIAGDRAKTKNSILKLLILGTAVSVMLYKVSNSFYYLFIIMSVFTFFQTSINPISDAITLEALDNTRWKFGPIRMAGSIGFAIMSVIAGNFVKDNISNIFILFFVIALAAYMSTFLLPTVKGHQSGRHKVSILKLFKNRKLVLLMGFNLIIYVTLGFYYSFFPIFYKQMGADTGLLGWSMLISALSEIPFLLFSDRILDKFGIVRTLMGSAIVASIRWVFLSLVTNIYLVPFINMLHGFNFIVLTVSMATYINKEIPRELKASGQTLNGLVGNGLGRILGSILGGYLSDIFGIRQVFLYNFLVVLVAVILFSGIFFKERKI